MVSKLFKLSPYRCDIHAQRRGKVLGMLTDWVAELTEACPDITFAFDAHARLFEPWQAAQMGNALAPFHPLFLKNQSA